MLPILLAFAVVIVPFLLGWRHIRAEFFGPSVNKGHTWYKNVP